MIVVNAFLIYSQYQLLGAVGPVTPDIGRNRMLTPRGISPEIKPISVSAPPPQLLPELDRDDEADYKHILA